MINVHLSPFHNVVSVSTGYNKIIWNLGESFVLGQQECN